MTSDLAQFLRDRLAEDESSARGRWNSEGATSANFHGTPYDPARVLREVDAKRRIVSAHPITRDVITVAPDGRHGFGCATCHQDEGQIIGNGWCDTLRALAMPYSDHPGYRSEWAPDQA